MAKNTGWVLFDTEKGKYVNENYFGMATLRKAKIYETRQEARNDQLGIDRIRKVRLKGKAVEIIKGR
ncbi:hypothetical protein LCGC14_1408850 [marine sediment metagenome]|uniref:Uncharacterized protein n=1 Tax=marine sediment metagenome TaxID=412755 RepID=A0A0F9MA88_9ZZZZ